MCPNCGLNLQPFWHNTPTNWATRPGLAHYFKTSPVEPGLVDRGNIPTCHPPRSCAHPTPFSTVPNQWFFYLKLREVLYDNTCYVLQSQSLCERGDHSTAVDSVSLGNTRPSVFGGHQCQACRASCLCLSPCRCCSSGVDSQSLAGMKRHTLMCRMLQRSFWPCATVSM